MLDDRDEFERPDEIAEAFERADNFMRSLCVAVVFSGLFWFAVYHAIKKFL